MSDTCCKYSYITVSHNITGGVHIFYTVTVRWKSPRFYADLSFKLKFDIDFYE